MKLFHKYSLPKSKPWFSVLDYPSIYLLVGFGRACAPVRCAHPSFWAYSHPKRGAAHPPPIAASLLAQKYKNKVFPDTKCLPSGPNSGRQGHIFFQWAKLHPTELRCTLLSYAAPYWATLHPTKLCCTLLSYAALYLSFAAPKSYAAPAP